jgi:hypothetical protein
VFVSGAVGAVGSAGGHVAAGTALFDGIDESGESQGKAAPVAEASCVPDVLVLLFSVIDTSKAGYGNAKIGERWRELSPVHQVHGKVPPTLIFHGTAAYGRMPTSAARCRSGCFSGTPSKSDGIAANRRCGLRARRHPPHGIMFAPAVACARTSEPRRAERPCGPALRSGRCDAQAVFGVVR